QSAAKTAFGPENRLEELFWEAAHDASQRGEFYRQFLESDLLVLGTTNKGSEGEIIADENTEVQIRHSIEEGKWIFPVFTSLKRICEGKTEGDSYLEMPARQILQLIPKHAGIDINPFSACRMRMDTDEIARLLDGSIFNLCRQVMLDPEQGLAYTVATDPPEKVINGLKSLFSRHPKVREAFVARMVFAERKEHREWIVGIDMDGDIGEIMGDCGVVVRETLPQNESINFIPLSSPEIGEFMRGHVKPFYVRK
ncbi:enhanced serine sensitivity protein SseB C-terminal domain-containing protein, partial [Candidatus Sumerlaeota bacterium]|nr:enhanced serine sensitivity protein SseB C-terminal domain-containing protein [Candidatus Sumerlaeota bacterium]